MKNLVLAAAYLAWSLLVVGCNSKPDEPAPATTGSVDAEPVVEEVEVEVLEVEPADEPPASDETAAAEDAAGEESTEPEPTGPRPSVFVRALTQPLEQAARENVESLQKTAGQLRLP